MYGNLADARTHANAALDASRGRDAEYAAALALALNGDSAQSQSLADDLEKRYQAKRCAALVREAAG